MVPHYKLYTLVLALPDTESFASPQLITVNKSAEDEYGIVYHIDRCHVDSLR